MKYLTWFSEWLENYVRPSVKERTYGRYKQLITRHIAEIGNTELSNLTPLILQKFVTGLLRSGNLKTGNGLAASTVNQVITLFKGSLRTAYMLGLMPEYTADKLKRPKYRERPVECFSVAEQRKIEGAVLKGNINKHHGKDKMYGIILCLYSGLRIGELLALQWDDIDFAKCTLAVSRSCHDVKGGLCIGEPKTQSSRRVIPLPKKLLPALKGIKSRSRLPFVVSANGKQVSVRSYQRSFARLLKTLNIPHRGFHSLRHTFATRAIECGIDVKTLAEVLGHKNATVTLNRYAHSLAEHKAEMMNRLGKFLSFEHA